MIWNLKSESPVAKFGEHLEAVKGIAWNPNQVGLLATGRGIAEKCIRFWNPFRWVCQWHIRQS
jgi:cell division cycle 20-like protein 1 (cofactor of APC complex)